MAITGPIALYNNLPIQPQNFQPRRFVIENIEIGITTLVTTAVNHNYVIAQQVRLLIPQGWGCTQLNELDGFVIGIPAADQVIVDINSSQFNQFISITSPQQPQILAIGDVNTGDINANGRSPTATFIPGSFINISPQPIN